MLGTVAQLPVRNGHAQPGVRSGADRRPAQASLPPECYFSQVVVTATVNIIKLASVGGAELRSASLHHDVRLKPTALRGAGKRQWKVQFHLFFYLTVF